jgi:hypothetical protein
MNLNRYSFNLYRLYLSMRRGGGARELGYRGRRESSRLKDAKLGASAAEAGREFLEGTTQGEQLYLKVLKYFCRYW